MVPHRSDDLFRRYRCPDCDGLYRGDGETAAFGNPTKEYITIAIGSIMVMFFAQVVFFFAVKSSSMTTISYTVLAFPIISLILEIIVGRVNYLP